MQSTWLGVVLAVAAALSSISLGTDALDLKEKRGSPQDLKLSGELPGLPAGSVRYVTLDQLSQLPQLTVRVSDDSNFSSPTDITGIHLDELLPALHIPDAGTMVAALCDDGYEGHYTDDYRRIHHPILVLRLNGKPPAQYPRTADGGVYGPYLISHASFQSTYHVLAHPEESQIPNGILELRFLKQDAVLDSIRPHGSFAENSPQMQGYVIARQNCFRCHNSGEYGGSKSGLSWRSLAHIAKADPEGFAAYTRDPQSQDPTAQMPGNPEYDDATLHVLTAYFQTFASAEIKK